MSGLMHYFEVQKLRKRFDPKSIHSIQLDIKQCLGVV
jgi:hypothetical protein